MGVGVVCFKEVMFNSLHVKKKNSSQPSISWRGEGVRSVPEMMMPKIIDTLVTKIQNKHAHGRTQKSSI